VSVGVSRTGKTSIVFVELGAKVNSQYYWLEGFWSGVTARHSCKMRSLVYKWMLQQDGAPSHITRSTACLKVLTSSNNPDMNQVNRAVWGNTPEDGFTMQKFKVFARTKKCNYCYCAWQVELS